MANVIASDVTIAGDKTFSGDIIASSPLSHRNIIINGAMMVDQRNNGSAVAGPQNTYTLDRLNTYQSGGGAYSVQQQTSVVPVGFSHSAKILVTTADTSIASDAYYMLTYNFEGYDTAHLEFGNSNAKTVTLSFYVRSNLTGTFTGAINNNASNRSYTFEYTISSANTWERKTITFQGDQTGTWPGAVNTRSIKIRWSLAMGSDYTTAAGSWGAGDKYGSPNQANLMATQNNTFYITGIQLELGDNATPFEHRSFGEELQKCQRYYQKSHDYSSNPSTSTDGDDAICGNSWADGNCNFEQGFVGGPMRTSPTVVLRPRGSTTTGQVNAAGTNRSASASQISSNTVGYIGITSGSNNNYVCFSYECKAEL
tara:strand:- start:1362 stop:2468 length:1107 start_codon:yes stop_codon:yes gene_type:complete